MGSVSHRFHTHPWLIIAKRREERWWCLRLFIPHVEESSWPLSGEVKKVPLNWLPICFREKLWWMSLLFSSFSWFLLFLYLWTNTKSFSCLHVSCSTSPAFSSSWCSFPVSEKDVRRTTEGERLETFEMNMVGKSYSWKRREVIMNIRNTARRVVIKIKALSFDYETLKKSKDTIQGNKRRGSSSKENNFQEKLFFL